MHDAGPGIPGQNQQCKAQRMLWEVAECCAVEGGDEEQMLRSASPHAAPPRGNLHGHMACG